MTIQTIRTLTGLTLEQAAAILDEQLPPDAYSAVPGGADLTDIDPNYMRKTLNAVFGLCGLGWGYDYKAEDIETRVATRQSKNGAYEAIIAVLKRLRWPNRLSRPPRDSTSKSKPMATLPPDSSRLSQGGYSPPCSANIQAHA